MTMTSYATTTATVQSWTPAEQPVRARHLHVVPDGAATPDRRWIERLTLNIVEVLAGQRSATTLVSWVSPVVFQALRTPCVDSRLRGGTLLSLRAQPLGPDAIEVAAVVGCPSRTRAVALRLALRHGRWRCVCVGIL